MNKLNIILWGIVALLLLLNSSCSDDNDIIFTGNDAHITSCFAKYGSTSFEATYLGDTIILFVPNYVDLQKVRVDIEVSEKASIHPLPETVTDWRDSVSFDVMSLSGLNTRKYLVRIVTITEEKEYQSAVRIGSQEGLDNFFESGYTKVHSIILYGGNNIDPIRDLSSMKTLKEVPGDFFIKGISAREIILDNLESIGNFSMQSPAATKVKFPKLKFVAQRFRIGQDDPGLIPESHYDLEDVYLPNLEYVGGQFTLNSCLKLKTLESFSKLCYIGEDLKINGGNFETLKGLDNIKNINGDLFLDGKLKNLDGLNITTVTGVVTIFCDDITDLSRLSVISNIGIAMVLKGNRLLKNLEGLSEMKPPVVHIESFLSLESLDGFPNVSSLEYLTLKGLPKLTDLSGLSGLERIEQTLLIEELRELVSLEGLNNLKYIGSNLHMYRLPLLKEVDALLNLTTIGGEILLSNLLELKSIAGFSNITEAKSIYFYTLPKLENIDALSSLQKVNGSLSILFCDLLENLDGLSGLKDLNLEMYDDEIKIIYNKKLTSYVGVGTLLQEYFPKGKVTIAGNSYNPTIADIEAGRFTPE